jgi:hypothetical protein
MATIETLYSGIGRSAGLMDRLLASMKTESESLVR